ncbi:MAG: TonB-dependent receptor [Flavobacteriaceae bacterium]|uniref:TonB-dependent receptor plug domain-containing protein n=1 Tax=Winogradskyella sp. SYSU M77433 TaxID=3042722 RepID=UPI000C65C63B|nr:TonB-dependent receptor [Winogradskyella sp. SYSU M77433]MAX69995.1 TonB-dependent receptor [Flavobacteriaceae bacterium]MDH7914097.1 TonB-dependent receptor [Winogradskyella sp. SYSU M77433]
MSLNKNKICIYFLFFISLQTFSQEKEQDSTKTEELKEVVVTGQYNPTTIKKSVYNVTVINRKQIEQIAANNLSDILNFNLNLNITPNAYTGRSTVSFFGLDSQYLNILVDNIPLVSDNGLGNNIDLTQINLDNVERIEIVEGAMGVEFGANAVSGVINIITKKSTHDDWQIQAYLQEETVSDEYEWFDKGRHIQSLNIAHNINENWFARLSFNRNDFAGFLNNREGRDYYQNDGLRGYEWLPKEQINTDALINYKTDKFSLRYKFGYYNENVFYYDAAVRANIDTQTQTSNPSSSDRIFTTNRFVNNLSLDGAFSSGPNYSATLSYQQQERDLNEFNYFILSQQRSNETDETYQSSKVIFSNGTLDNIIKDKSYDFQVGYEMRYIEGFDTQASGEITQQNKTRKQNNYALFGSSEIKLTDKFSIRPGLRYEYNSLYNSKFIGAFNARYLLENGFELRANIGSSYRVPNFEELYYYFVDSNHDVRGNENLKPENGFSTFINLKKRSWFNGISLVNNFKFSYIDVSDRIDLAVVNSTPLQYQYINIDKFRQLGFTLDNSLRYKNLTLNIGATLQGISRENSNEVNGEDDYLYNFQINTRASYYFEKVNTSVSMLLKYNGKQQNYRATGTDDDGNSIYSIATIDDYTWLDLSVRKTFLDNKLDITLGSRNLFDITNVNISSTGSSGGTHSTSNSNLLLGYGRSFYLKAMFNLNF